MRTRIAKLLVFVILLIAVTGLNGCGGGDSSSAVTNGAPKAKLAVNLSYIATADSGTPSADSYGTVEILVSRGVGELQKFYAFVAADYKARKADVEVTADDDTFSITIKARLKIKPTDNFETVYTASKSVYVSKDQAGTPVTIKLDLQYLNKVVLVPSSLNFSPAPAASVKKGEKWPAFTVNIFDQFGSALTGAQDTVELAVSSGVIRGVISKIPIGGSAAFDDIYSDTAGSLSLTAKCGGAYSKSISVNVVDANVKPYAAMLSFSPAPAPMTPVNGTLREFSVKILDSYGMTIDTSENVIVSDESGALGGILTVAAVKGVATFKNVSASKAAKINIKATAAGISATSGTVNIINGEVANSLMVISTYHFIIGYDMFYGISSGKPAAAITYKWAIPFIDGVRRMRKSEIYDKLYVLDNQNKFWILTGLNGQNPGMQTYNLKGNSQLLDFIPSSDEYRMFLAGTSQYYNTLFKWHIINDPEFLTASMNFSGSGVNNLIEYDTNKLYIAGKDSVIPVDYSSAEGVQGISIPILNSPCGMAIGPSKETYVAESGGKNVYSISSGAQKVTMIPLGAGSGASTQSYLKYINYGGRSILYMALASESGLYGYDLSSSKAGSAAFSGYLPIYPCGIETCGGGRFILLPNGGTNAFVRIVSNDGNYSAEDFTVTGSAGETLVESISGMVIY